MRQVILKRNAPARRPTTKMMEMREDSTLPCGTCSLCCRGGEAVVLHPEHGDDLSLYQTVELPITLYGKTTMQRMLKQKPNGDCSYLGEHGCTIYEQRPKICRAFSCVKFYDWLGRMPATERKQVMAESNDSKREIITKAKEMKDRGA